MIDWMRVVESRSIDVDGMSWASEVESLSGCVLCGVWSMDVDWWETVVYEVVGVVHVT